MDTKSGSSSAPSTENDPPISASGGTTASQASGSIETYPTLTSTEQAARVKQFFQLWTEPSEDLTRCPPEKDLLDAARNPIPTDWPEHIQHCEACKSLVQLIANPGTERIAARQILAEADRLAWLTEQRTRRRRFTPRKYFEVFFNPPVRAKRMAVATLVIVALGVVGWLAWLQLPPPAHIVERNRDNYFKTIEWFDRTNIILADEGLKPLQKAAELQALKSQKAEIEAITNSLQLDDSQRAELAKRKATYNNQTMILTAELHLTSPRPEDLPFKPTPESAIVTQVWAAFGSLNGEPIPLDRQDTDTAKALLEASEYTDITKITQDQSKTTVTVSFLDTSIDKNKPEVKHSISLLENSGVSVNVVPFDESTRPFKARKTSKFQGSTRQ